MQDLHPYTTAELQRMRRLIVAAGQTVEAWSARLRRSADFLQGLSPGQAAIVAQQAAAIAADPDDLGEGVDLFTEQDELEALPEAERATYLARQIIAIRRAHFPGDPDE